MSAGAMDHLDELESRGIHVLREAYSCIPNLAMLWSIGKDSTVLLYLARKAFFGHVPFPLVHIDTAYKIPEMTAYRDRLALEWQLTMVVGRNDAALEAKKTFPDGTVDLLRPPQDPGAQGHAEREGSAVPAEPRDREVRARPQP